MNEPLPANTSVWRTRLFSIGAWCFVVVGVAHLLVQVGALAGSRPATLRVALDEMAHASSSLLVLDRSLLQLFYGFSVTMGLLALGLGILDLVVARQAPHLVTRGRAVLATNLALSAPVLAVSVLAFPEPPIVALAIATAAFALALAIRPGTSPRETPAAKGASRAGRV